MKAIEPLECLNRKTHTAMEEIMPFEIYYDISRYMMGDGEGHARMRSLHSLRNAVISRRADSFVDMATFALQLHQLSTIKTKKPMDNSRTLAGSLLLVVVSFVAIFCMTWLRIERLEEKVDRIQQSVGYYEDETP